MTLEKLGSEASGPPSTRAVSSARLRSAWTPPATMDYTQWATAGRRIAAMSRASSWWVGDWIRYGIERWGERYAIAARVTGYDVHSLRNMAYVASRFPPSLRRDDLTWSHHALLAALQPSRQAYWLERAATERLSVADLRIELRALRRGEKCTDSPTTRSSSVCPNCGFHLQRASP